MIRGIRKPDRLRMLTHVANGWKSKLVRFLQEKIKLPDLVSDVLDHPDSLGRMTRYTFAC
jgi:hypothetical protein